MKHLIDLITSIKPVLNNALSAVFTEVKIEPENASTFTTSIFQKCCKLLKIDTDSIQLVLW